MNRRHGYVVGTALLTIALAAFLIGRAVEREALRGTLDENRQSNTPLGSPAPVSVSSYRELRAMDIIGLPFPEFYEALRSAPGEARKKWADELRTMPAGPRRTAAVSGFYKLLVQFDPTAAAKAIKEIEDKEAQTVAIDAASKAAPGFALPELTATIFDLPTRFRGGTDCLAWLLREWMEIDPAAVVRFLDEHKDEYAPSVRTEEVIANWAMVDPETARAWIDQRQQWTPDIERSFIDGWYESDRTAAVSYVLAHANNPDMREPIGDILTNLYFDAKDEARKFIEDLPADKRQDAIRAAFLYLNYNELEATGEPKRTPQEVRDWLVQFPAAYWKETLGMTFFWTAKPSREVLAWIERQPAPIRDAVAAEYTPSRETQLVDAIVPIIELADPKLRDELLIASFKNSHGLLAEVQDKIASVPISAEQKAHILRLIAQVDAEATNAPSVQQ
jgi:hypothetical protein